MPQGRPWERYGGQTPQPPAIPRIIQGPPREPPLQTPEQATVDRFQAQEAPLDVEAQRLENEERRLRLEGTPRERENDRIQRVTQLRQEFNSRPDVRGFLDLRNSTRQIQRLGQNESPQGDIAMIFSFMKALDPTSAVREQEQANAQNATGVPDIIRNYYNQVLEGNRLNPEQRQEMVRTATDIYLSRARTYNEIARQYQPLFQQFGEDPNRHILIALGPEREEERDRLAREEDQIVVGEGYIPGEEGDISTDPQAIYEADLRRQGEPGAGELLQHGSRLGLSDEVAGVSNAFLNAVTAPFMSSRDFDPIGAYQAGNEAVDMRLDRARENSGALGTGAEILGGFASGRPSLGPLGAGPGGRTLWNYTPPNALRGRIRQGATVGAGTGALAGFGYGEGVAGSAVDALKGAGLGVAVGAALPVIGAGASALLNVGRSATGNNPTLARRAIAQAIADDSNTPAVVGSRMAEARANDVPLMLADTGENTRGLLAATSRASGRSRTLSREALDERQAGLAERVTRSIERDLGPVSNPHVVADDLIASARTAAAPLYEQAYARPGADAFAQRIGELVERPAMRRAMNRAVAIAREEGRDPTTMGFDVNEAGEVLAIRTPSWQTFDYVKRGLDDVLNSQPRDPASGRIIMDEGTRAIDQTRRQFLSRFDRANPEYRDARAAWAGPVQSREAMDLGRRSLNMTADDLTARTQGMSAGEMEFLRLGVRRAMAERIASLGDTANVPRALLGTGKKRAFIMRLFGGRQEFDRFVETLQQEQAGFETYRTARLGSPTAPNLQDDSALATAVRDVGTDMLTTGVPGVMASLRQAWRFGTGEAARKAQEQIAAILSEADPTRLNELARELRREAAKVRRTRTQAGRRATLYGRAAGQAGGMASSSDRR